MTEIGRPRCWWRFAKGFLLWALLAALALLDALLLYELAMAAWVMTR